MKNLLNRINSGIFFLSLTTLIYEILLIRILSVLMFYSFVSLIISLSLFGIGIGALSVHLFADKFQKKGINLISGIFAATLIIPFFLLILIELSPIYLTNILGIFHPPLHQPFRSTFYSPDLPLESYIYLTIFFLLITIPFFFSGILSTLIISNNNEKISKLYFFDLIGASLGSILIIPLLNFLGAPAAILFNTGLGFLIIFFLSDENQNKISKIIFSSLMATIFLAAFFSSYYKKPEIKIVRGYYEPNIIYSEWNAISRVVVHSGQIQMVPNRISSTYRGNIPGQLGMAINDVGYTIMVRFDGDMKKIEYVKYLINSLVYSIYENKNKSVLLIGPGGGEDILGAYAAKSDLITAVEINPTMVELTNNKFKDFSGAPYSLPNVKTIIENARSFIRYSPDKFDVISSSLVYEWFEPTAGAFSLSESSLYTLEGFTDYFSHLTPDGVINICQFTDKRSVRLTAMAIEALKKHTDTIDQHIFIAQSGTLGSFLFKKSPFTASELSILKDKAEQLNFRILYSPDLQIQNKYYDLIKTKILAEYYAKHEDDFSPPTDNRPFFNFLVKPSSFFSLDFWTKSSDFENNAIYILKESFLLAIIMIGFLIGLPFIFNDKNKTSDSALDTISILAYFGCIGFGFMLIEISLMRKFNVILSHPTLSISLVLFSLLFTAGIGSLVTDKIKDRIKILLFTLVVFLFIYILFIDSWLHLIEGPGLFYRSIKSILIILPLSFFMGMPLPLGIKMINNNSHLIPWIWSINAGMSVLGAIFGFIFALNFGFNATMYAALTAYIIALLII
ncbi:hypothetical protein HZA55_08695 [Candidatus Poribacteria bacterium]|nr:hypothetical protein [Candidatus Poribacteria bacterium]